MDLSFLLSQAQLNYTKNNFNKGSKSNKKINNQSLVVQVFENNLDLISSFLKQKQINNLRLLCRGVGYLFIVRDLWTGMKMQVADKKLQDMDNYQFIEQQPKQISKQDKKIRIHSLKKNISNRQNVRGKRQASNIKQKNKEMAIISNEFNMTMTNALGKTQIGFKRLLKANNSMIGNNTSMIKTTSKLYQKNKIIDNIDQAMTIERLPQFLQIPKEYSIEDLIISPNDQWIKNVHRANNLISVIKKWNKFYQRFWIAVSKEENQLLPLMKKMIKIDGCLLNYKTTLCEEEPHCSIIDIICKNAPTNGLIEEDLNKLGREFLMNHNTFLQFIQKKQSQKMIKILHQCYQKITLIDQKSVSIKPGNWVECLSNIEQGYKNLIQSLITPKLKSSLLKSVNKTFSLLMEGNLDRKIYFEESQVIKIKQINLKFIIKNSEFCQLLFQILYNFYNRIGSCLITQNSPDSNRQLKDSVNKQKQSTFTKKHKLLQPVNISSNNSLIHPSTADSERKISLNKSQAQSQYKNEKKMYGILWNMSKYYDKLQKQVQAKEKQKKQDPKIQLIKNFLENEGDQYNETIIINFSNINNKKVESKSEGSKKDQKSLEHLEQYYKVFKNKIENLKQEMAKSQN